MKYVKLFSAVLFAGLLKVNAQDCDVVKNILRSYYQIDEAADCCSYAFNDQYAVGCNGGTVTSLSIVNNPNILEVPADVATLAGLEKVDFSNCNVQQFPYHLKTLPNLKSLSLWKNGIVELTDEISQFPVLENLDLGENGLTVIPESIGSMANLNSLNLYRNYLTALPNSIYQLTKLKKLNVEGNSNLGGSLMPFGGEVDSCNIRNTHLCIEKKEVCKNYIVSNSRMPYCHPEMYTEDELEAGSNGSDTASGSKKSHTALIIIGIVLALILIGVIAAILIAKNRKNNNNQYGNVNNKMGQNARLEENYGNTNQNYQQVNQQPQNPNFPPPRQPQASQQANPNYQQPPNFPPPRQPQASQANPIADPNEINRISGSTVNTEQNSFSVDVKPLVKH